MNEVGFGKLCCLFCCPPCPTKIASKLAFLPPQPTYQLVPNDTFSHFSLKFTDRADWHGDTDRLHQNIDVFFTTTKRGNRIACVHCQCVKNPKFTIMYSHGNAVDLGNMLAFYYSLGEKLGCNVFGYDYSGYGASGGKPSEKNLYADADAALSMLTDHCNVDHSDIILYGQSIGTVPTIDLASHYQTAGVILHSALMSGLRAACPGIKRDLMCDSFVNIEKIPRIGSTVLVIHGTEDEVIDFSHGLSIYERCPLKTEPLWVQGAGHNDIETHQQYLERLQQFIHHELSAR